MSFISRVFNQSIDDPFTKIVERFWGVNVNSGVTVSESSALKYVTVYSCVRVLAETIGSLPLFVYQARAGGGADKVHSHPAYHLLHNAPNDEMTSQTWRETIMGHIALSGNGYSRILRDDERRYGNAGLLGLEPLDWQRVEPFRDRETKRLMYRITNDDGTMETLVPRKILHIPGLGYDGIMGYSPVSMAREAIGLGLASTEFAARFFGQGMNIGGVLEHPGKLSDPAKQNLQKSLDERGSGLANSWRPFVLEEGMKWSRIPMPLTDAQFLETRKFTRDEICGLFRVPPHMIANLERSTNNNIEHQSLEFVKYTILPWITRWEQTLNWKLFGDNERARGLYVKFNVEGLLRGDYKSRQEGLGIQRQNGIINANEWREMEEMNPIEGVSGDAYLVNGNMISTETASKQQPRKNPSGNGGENGNE